MRDRLIGVAVFLLIAVGSGAGELAGNQENVESRGKKKKIALFVYFADLIVKKIFIFKIIYAILFWAVIHKAGYFLGWFVSYLKEKKNEYKDHHHHQNLEYGPEYSSYGPYRRQYPGNRETVM